MVKRHIQISIIIKLKIAPTEAAYITISTHSSKHQNCHRGYHQVAVSLLKHTIGGSEHHYVCPLEGGLPILLKKGDRRRVALHRGERFRPVRNRLQIECNGNVGRG
jgi:hypothetical protein